MVKMKKSFYFLFLIGFQGLLSANLIDEGILMKSDNNNACLIYQPYLGTVKDIDNLDIKSDKFQINDEKILFLDGNVAIDFPDGILKTGIARIDQDKGLVNFKKNGDLFLKDYFFRAQEGSFNKDEQLLELKKGELFIESRGLIVRFDDLGGDLDKKILLNNVSMTSCADTSDGWELAAERIEIDDATKRGKAEKVKIKIFDQTIIKLPYLPFATSSDRMTGFLEPTLSYSSDGLDFMIPYFKVISEKSDVTLAARNISERGFGFEGNIRAVHGDNKHLRSCDFIYFNEDKEYQELYPKTSDSRWGFNLLDTFGNKNKFWMDIDWSKTSDSLVLRDIPGEITTIGKERAQNLKQTIVINSVYNNLSFKLEHEGYQTLNPVLTNGYKKSPVIAINYFKNLNNFTVSQDINVTYFKAKSIHGYLGYEDTNNKFLSLISNPVEGRRTFSSLKVNNNSYLNGFKISSTIGIQTLSYNLDSSMQKTNSVAVPDLSIDISSLFVNKIDEAIHLIKPKIFYGYVGYKDQSMNPVFDSNNISKMNQIFNVNRFSGMDRIGDENFYSLGINYTKREMGRDKFSFEISKKYYLKDRKVSLNDLNMHSLNMSSMQMMSLSSDEDPLMLMSKWMPNMSTMIMTYGNYHKDQKKFPMAGITAKHKFEKGSIGYAKRYTKMSGDFNTELDYSEFFANFELKNNFSLITKFKRDDESGTKIESIFGVGYENCCVALSVTASDRNLSKYLDGLESDTYTYLNDAWDNIITIENKSRINFEFQLKGLNSTFEKVGRLMNNSILNY